MANYLRQGTCNWCGQCCGAPYTYGGDPPSEASPWPKDWPWAVAAWSPEALDAHFPFRQLLAAIEVGYGEIKITGKRYPYIFIEGEGIMTDEEPLGDPSTFSRQCPLLKLLRDDSTPSTPQDPATECAAANHTIFQNYCVHLPPSILNEEEVLQWQEDYPACSYTWIPE
jgi:hypothetical protein